MKTTFSKDYIINNKGCYEVEQVNALPFDKENKITLEALFTTIPIKDFIWFLVKKCELTILQKQLLGIDCAKFALQFYEAKYPNDSRVKECIEATEGFLNGDIERNVLIEKRDAADAAYDAAYAAYAYAYAADAAAYAAAAAIAAAAADAAYDAAYADAAYAAAAYAYAAAAAYDAADYKENVRKFVFDTLLNQ